MKARLNIDHPTPITAIPTCKSCINWDGQKLRNTTAGIVSFVKTNCLIHKMKTGVEWTCADYSPIKINGYEKLFKDFINRELKTKTP